MQMTWWVSGSVDKAYDVNSVICGDHGEAGGMGTTAATHRRVLNVRKAYRKVSKTIECFLGCSVRYIYCGREIEIFHPVDSRRQNSVSSCGKLIPLFLEKARRYSCRRHASQQYTLVL